MSFLKLNVFWSIQNRKINYLSLRSIFDSMVQVKPAVECVEQSKT